jgi:hypothetical protein
MGERGGRQGKSKLKGKSHLNISKHLTCAREADLCHEARQVKSKEKQQVPFLTPLPMQLADAAVVVVRQPACLDMAHRELAAAGDSGNRPSAAVARWSYIPGAFLPSAPCWTAEY